MIAWSHHLIVTPILIPMVTAALLLFIDERNRTAKALVSLAGVILLLANAVLLFAIESGPNGFDNVGDGVTGSIPDGAKQAFEE